MGKFETVETVIDRFLEYVRANKKISLVKVASALAITTSQAERIAILLEQSGFIELNYGIAGVSASAKDKKIELAEVVKANVVQKSIAVQESEEIEKEILTAENLLKFFEKDIFRRIEISQKLLANLEKSKDLSKEDVAIVEKEVNLALGQLAAFSGEITLLADQEEAFYNKLSLFKEKLAAMKKNRQVKEEVNLLQRIVDWIKSLLSRFSQKKTTPLPKWREYAGSSGITFLGKGFVDSAQSKAKKPKRVLKLRVDRMKQHYWKKRKLVK